MNKKTYIHAIVTLLFLLSGSLYGFSRPGSKDSIEIVPGWEIGEKAVFEASMYRKIKNDTIAWQCNCTSIQTMYVAEKLDDGFLLNWTASGFALNLFSEFPGTMFDWTEEWLEGRHLLLSIRTSTNGVLLELVNREDVILFFTDMLNSMLAELPNRDISPLIKDDVTLDLINIRENIITTEGFENHFLKNIQLVFALYNKKFNVKHYQSSTIYKDVPTLKFLVPMEITTSLNKHDDSSIEVKTSILPKPYEEWRIKPSNYRNIDFEWKESSRFTYDMNDSWAEYAESAYFFKRGKIEMDTNINFVLKR